ncbi:hypothetical protein [Dactylosporangium sp. NPDC051484]|uniref:hypothetical protein n=1 Tax=Dactylosporangium sp. NPDC051484 TaxID=3154942 RepID=UPI00344D962E
MTGPSHLPGCIRWIGWFIFEVRYAATTGRPFRQYGPAGAAAQRRPPLVDGRQGLAHHGHA